MKSKGKRLKTADLLKRAELAELEVERLKTDMAALNAFVDLLWPELQRRIRAEIDEAIGNMSVSVSPY